MERYSLWAIAPWDEAPYYNTILLSPDYVLDSILFIVCANQPWVQDKVVFLQQMLPITNFISQSDIHSRARHSIHNEFLALFTLTIRTVLELDFPKNVFPPLDEQVCRRGPHLHNILI